MSTIAIMQPTYLPWAGYFNLITRADHFVFLDDVKIEKQSWQVRNKILYNQKEAILSLPTQGSRNQLINEVMLNETTPWRKKQSKFLQYAYAKHPFGLDCLEVLLPIINNEKHTLLCELNIQIIKSISNNLGFDPTFHRSSGLGIFEARSKRLISICQKFSCNNYLSPAGAKEYIEKDGDFSNSAIIITYQEFTPPKYPQKNLSTFMPYLSIIDMIANIGYSETSKLIQTT